MITKTYLNYKKYGRVLSITNGTVTVMVTVDLGPRIIYLAREDGDNIFFEDLNDVVNKSGEYFDTNFKKGEAWHIYGGHRLWKSPEDLASYAPDNYAVEVEELECGAIFTSAPEKMTGLQKSIRLTMCDCGEITLEHTFKNVGEKTQSVSLWVLSVMNKGGRAYVPVSTEDTGLLSNRNVVLWSYTDINDKRLELRNDAIVLRQDERADKPIKVGFFTPIGEAYYQYNSKLFKKSFSFDENASYPDHDCNVECYTSPDILEVETLSPLYEIAVGEEKTHVEVWNLYGSDSKEYKEIDKKF